MIERLRRLWRWVIHRLAPAREVSDVVRLTEEQIALHEAAHAVVSVILGVPVAAAVLCGSGQNTRGGYVSECDLSPADDPEHVGFGVAAFTPVDVQTLQQSLVGVSGGVVEKLISLAAGPRMNARMGLPSGFAAHDEANLELFATTLIKRPSFVSRKGYDKEHLRFRAYIDQWADHLIELNEKWIQCVAQALIRERRFTAAQIRALQPRDVRLAIG